jgi:hypothetical protein
MASFQGRKPKDSFGEALKMDSGNVSGTPKNVTDGDGNSSALNLATTKVSSSGDLEATGSASVGGTMSIGTVNAGTTELDALVVNGSGEVLKRTLGSGAFQPYYDSGWRDLNTYTGGTTYGLPPYDDKPNYAQYRVVNRTVFLRGNVYIPLTDGGGGYVNPYSGTITSTNTGVDTSTGWSISAGNVIMTPNLTNNPTIAPDNTVVFKDRRGSRLIKSGNSSDGLRLYTIMSLFLNTDGTLSFQSVKDVEEPSGGGLNSTQIFQDQRRYALSKVEVGDFALDWQNYRTSSDGSSSFYNVWTHGTNTYPFTFDGSDSTFLGGIDFSIDGMFYQISSATSISDIANSIENP